MLRKETKEPSFSCQSLSPGGKKVTKYGLLTAKRSKARSLRIDIVANA